MCRGRIDKLVNSIKGKTIFQMRLVEIDVVNTYSSFPITFFYEDYVVEPLQVVNFINRTNLEEFSNFLHLLVGGSESLGF